MEDKEKIKDKKERKNRSNKTEATKEPKVKDLISLLETIDKIAQNPLNAKENSNQNYIKSIIEQLIPLKNESVYFFIDQLRNLISTNHTNSKALGLSLEEINKLSNEDIRKICSSSEKYPKNVFEEIGSIHLNLSKSLLKSSSKEKVINLITSSLDNLEIFDSIGNKASKT